MHIFFSVSYFDKSYWFLCKKNFLRWYRPLPPKWDRLYWWIDEISFCSL